MPGECHPRRAASTPAESKLNPRLVSQARELAGWLHAYLGVLRLCVLAKALHQ